VIDAMSDWGLRWGTPDPDPADLDPLLVICMLHFRLRDRQLPEARIVIEVVAKGYRDVVAWLVCEKGGVSMCYDHPGFDIDLSVVGKASTLYQVAQQRTPMAAALACGQVQIDGPSALVNLFTGWFESPASSAKGMVRA
jgi:hypothetical protein